MIERAIQGVGPGVGPVVVQGAGEVQVAPVGGSVLLVDDDPAVARTYMRLLSRAGFDVEIATESDRAVARFKERSFDVILSDIDMPGMNGIQLLRAVRERDLDLPVVLMTGRPHMDSAVNGMEFGALGYLIKPVARAQLESTINRAVKLHHMARLRRQALDLFEAGGRHLGDRASLEVRFERALQSLWIAYQPIVSWTAHNVFAYEALVRNREATLGSPIDLLDAAARLNRSNELGRAIRDRVASRIPEVAADTLVFVNIQASDLDDDLLFSDRAPLSAHASRVVLEITERAALDQIPDLMSRIAALRAMGYGIAVDDLGAGYAGLTSFAQLEPEVVKVDMSLIRDLHQSHTKQALIGSMVDLCTALGIKLVAEGIEAAEERDALLRLGGDLCQGYLFARPGPGFAVPCMA